MREPDPADCSYPLSTMQAAYFVGRGFGYDLGNVASHAYHELQCDNLDIVRLETSLNRLIDRHPCLRTTVLKNGCQQVLSTTPYYRIRVDDLSGLPDAAVADRLRKTRDALSHQYFPIGSWPMFDIRVSRLNDHQLRLHVSLDTLLLDASSMFSFFSEWRDTYDGGRDNESEQPRLSYKDYVLAEASARNAPEYIAAQRYWERRIKTMPPAPQIGQQRIPLPVKPEFRRRQINLEQSVWSEIKQLAKTHGLTPTSVCLAAWSSALLRQSSEQRFTLCLTLFNGAKYQQTEAPPTLGNFTACAPVAIKGGHRNFRDFALEIQRDLWSAFENRAYHGVDAMRLLAREHGLPHRSAVLPFVFTSTLGLARHGAGAEAIERFGPELFGVSQTPQVLVDHIVLERHGALRVEVDYVPDAFPEGIVESLCREYELLIRRCAALQTWTESISAAVREPHHVDELIPDLTIDQLILDNPDANRSNIAVQSGDGDLTYGALFDYSARLAAQLSDRGARPGTYVAIVMAKSWQHIVAILAVLRTGAAYIPIDKDGPQRRTADLLARANANIVLTDEIDAQEFNWSSDRTLIYVAPFLESANPKPARRPHDKHHPAYVMYTSGSTGMPKGVIIGHSSVVNFVLDMTARFSITAEDTFACISRFGFDLSIFDIFCSLAVGASMALPARPEPDPKEWYSLVENNSATIWNSVPAAAELLADYCEAKGLLLPASVRLVILSGDVVTPKLVERFRRLGRHSSFQIVSAGGPTETTVWNIMHVVGRDETFTGAVPYGRPTRNNKYFVLTEALTECPVGVAGELYAAGAGLMNGYLNDPAGTLGAFCSHPQTGERLYRTGDRGRLREDGSIEFLGRSDTQVKLNGYRIELGEIETVVRRHPDVANAIVLASDCEGIHQIVAVVEPVSPLRITRPTFLNALAEHVRSYLPYYMVPGKWVVRNAMMLTANGKIDRNALTSVLEQCEPVDGVAVSRTSALNEWIVTKVFEEVLRISNVGPDDDFFVLGGNSLSAVRAVALINQESAISLSLRDFLEQPSARALVASIASGVSASD